MSTQPPPRQWFRLASIMRPPPAPAPAPAPAPQPPLLQPPPPIPPFRPTVALARPLPPAAASPPPRPPAVAAIATTAPPSPVAPAPVSSPIVSRTSATPTTPRSPEITGAPPPAASPPPRSPTIIGLSPPSASPPPRSPAITGVPPPAASTTRSPVATPAPAPQPTAVPKPESPLVKISSPSPPASPGQKALATETSATRPVVSSSPITKITAHSSPLPTSPATKTLLSSQSTNAAPTIANVTARVASPVPPPHSPVVFPTVRAPAPSPKTVKPGEKSPPPHESPIAKHLSHPPSPLTLPPPQLKADHLEPIPAEAEQKTVLMQYTDKEKPKTTLKTSQNNHGEIHSRVPQSGERELKKDKGGMMYKKNSDSSPEFGIRVVTLAGENKGAVMELNPASRKKYDFQEKGSSRAWNNGQKLGSTNDEGKNNTVKDQNDGKATKMQSPPMDAFVNSNVQEVNNSILHNCTYKNRDPGVHLSVSRKGNGSRGLHLQDSGHHD